MLIDIDERDGWSVVVFRDNEENKILESKGYVNDAEASKAIEKLAYGFRGPVRDG